MSHRYIHKLLDSLGSPSLVLRGLAIILLLALAIGATPAHAQTRILVLTSNESSSGYNNFVTNFRNEFSGFDVGAGATVTTSLALGSSTLNAAPGGTFLDARGQPRYDIVAVMRVAPEVFSTDFNALQTAIQQHQAKLFVFVMDGYDYEFETKGQNTGNRFANLLQNVRGASTIVWDWSDSTVAPRTYNRNGTSAHAALFSPMTSFIGIDGYSWAANTGTFPNNNLLYTTSGVSGASGVYLPRANSYSGSGACVFAIGDSSGFGGPGAGSNTYYASNAGKLRDSMENVYSSSGCASSADLSIAKTDNTTTYTPGMTGTYQLTTCNNGPDDAWDVAVNDTLPLGVTLTAQWTCAAGGGGGLCPPTPSGGTAGTRTIAVTGIDLPYTAPTASCVVINAPVRFSANAGSY